MLRGIFLMSRPPLLRERGEFAALQLNPTKTKPPFVNTAQNIQPAWVLARRGCAFWTGLPIQGKFIRTRKSSLQTSKLQSQRLRAGLHSFAPPGRFIHTARHRNNRDECCVRRVPVYPWACRAGL